MLIVATISIITIFSFGLSAALCWGGLHDGLIARPNTFKMLSLSYVIMFAISASVLFVTLLLAMAADAPDGWSHFSEVLIAALATGALPFLLAGATLNIQSRLDFGRRYKQRQY